MRTLCLAVDIGNSCLKISRLDLRDGIFSEPLRITWRHNSPSSCQTSTRDLQTPRFAPHDAAWLGELQGFLAANIESDSSPSFGAHTSSGPDSSSNLLPCSWIVASVRGDALGVLRDFVAQRRQDSLHVVTRTDLDIQVNVDFPDRVGIDRLLAALAATRATDHRPLLVIQAGSAVTVDLVTCGSGAQASFEGGAILPGVPMMLRLLGKAADMLPELEADDLTDLPPIPGKSTEAAMTCGAASALVGGIQHLLSRYRSAYGSELPVIISGGDGMRISTWLQGPLSVAPHLVQGGLLLVAQTIFLTANE